MTATDRRWRGTLAARIALVFLALLLAVQVVSFLALRLSLSHHQRDKQPERVSEGGLLLQRLLDNNVDTAKAYGRSLGKEPAIGGVLVDGDSATIASALENFKLRAHASKVAFLDLDFKVRSTSSQGNAREVAAAVTRLRPLDRDPGIRSGIVLMGGNPFQAVMVQLNAPRPVGWALMAFPLDESLVRDMKRLAGLDLTLLVRSTARSPWVVDMTSLDALSANDLSEQAWNVAGPTPAMVSVPSQGDEIGVHAVVLGGDHGDSSVVALVSVSLGDAARLPADLRLALIVITLLAVGVFAAGSVVTARRVTTPLRGLADAAERLGAGDYETPMRKLTREDEIGALSQSFERMRTSVAENQAQILRLAYRDTLTSLPNRARFREAAGEAIRDAADARLADGAEASVAILMLDLNRFKHVNDVLGYGVGDQVLVGIAERLRRALVRDGDLVARLNGDEFGILLRHTDAQQAHAMALRIEQSLEQPLVLGEHKVDMGAGIGVACWPLHAVDADTLLVRSEMAMYEAKRRSNGPVTYDPAIDATSAQTLTLISELRQAVERNELRLYLQPKLALDDRRVVGAEALVRWQHPQRGLVPPMQFIPFAEQTGFIRTLTMWVFEEAARHWLALADEGLQLRLSVNLSTRDLLDLDLPQKFAALLARHAVPAHAFCLEITESAIMDDPQRALGTLDALSAMGFKLSIDDFGTGYSSLAYLKRLPVDELKIDKSFVMSMVEDLDDAKIVRSTIDLAHNLGLTVVAEGVESAKVWDALRELECDEAQGYHMGKPMPATEFNAWSMAWLAKNRPRLPAASAFMLH